VKLIGEQNMIMKDKILSRMEEVGGKLTTVWDLSTRFGVPENVIRARISELRKAGEPLVSCTIQDGPLGRRKGWMISGYTG
jgi:hypothetical protein